MRILDRMIRTLLRSVAISKRTERKRKRNSGCYYQIDLTLSHIRLEIILWMNKHKRIRHP